MLARESALVFTQGRISLIYFRIYNSLPHLQ